MQKPYKHIQDSKKVLKSLVSEAKTMGNVKTRLTELNTLIRLVNSFEEMLNKKYFTEYFDILLLSRLYHFFLDNDVYATNEVPIQAFLYWLDRDNEKGKENIKKDITGLLQGCQLNESLKDGKCNFDTHEQWSEVLEDTLLKVKEQIQWKTKCKK